MFTGLIGDLGIVSAFERSPRGVTVRIRTRLADELNDGDSIAVNGVCLTATELAPGEFAAQLMAETLARSSLASLAAGARVNLELPLRPSDRLGGHFVQGHVDTTAVVREIRRDGEWQFFTFAIDASWTELLVPKGSIAVDGVSLTLVEVWSDAFSVMLIPHTLAVTTLGSVRPGDRVNIEVDILAKHVRKLLVREPRAGWGLPGGQTQ